MLTPAAALRNARRAAAAFVAADDRVTDLHKSALVLTETCRRLLAIEQQLAAGEQPSDAPADVLAAARTCLPPGSLPMVALVGAEPAAQLDAARRAAIRASKRITDQVEPATAALERTRDEFSSAYDALVLAAPTMIAQLAGALGLAEIDATATHGPVLARVVAHWLIDPLADLADAHARARLSDALLNNPSEVSA